VDDALRIQALRRPHGARALGRYRDPTTACLAAIGLLSPGFVILVAVAGLAAPHYSAVHDEVSDLGLGVTAAVLDGGFVAFGALLCLFAAGLRRSFRADATGRRGALGLGLVGVAVACLAAFPTDADARHPTLHGTIHGALFLAGIGGFVFAAWHFARAFRRDPLWRRIAGYTQANAVAIVAVWAVWEAFASVQAFDPHPPLGAVGGLIERVLILGMAGWIAVVALRHTQLALVARRATAGDRSGVRGDRRPRPR
jgi:hypothetical membrane protein